MYKVRNPSELEPSSFILRLSLLLAGVLASPLGPATAAAQGAVQQIPAAAVPPPASCPSAPADGTRADATLVNTDAFVLERFQLARVYDQLLALSGQSAPSSTELYQQMWDSVDVAANAKFDGPHCDDNATTINGFAIDCPRPETALKSTTPDTFVPVALFNRFDLAAADGANCGEYRIIYAAKAGSISGRDFIIFEAALPNPNPSCGVEACRPVVNFWESLASLDPSAADGQKALADGLERFYFSGLEGFEPVVHPKHYGESGFGQIRTNTFTNSQKWQLREYHLGARCAGACKLALAPVTVKTNPFRELFNVAAATADARAADFQGQFPAQTVALANDQVAQISMAIDDRFNAGQSTSQDPNDDYERQFKLGDASSPFSAALQSQLASAGRTDLTPADIARRATTQSCAGCHQLSNGAALGGMQNPKWPSSRGFVQVDESGHLSQALWCAFLPARKGVLDGFAASPSAGCPSSPTPTVVREASQALAPLPHAGTLTVSGKPLGPN